MLEDETLRDGLQIESRLFSLEEKIDLFHLLKNAGLGRIQVGSFVHPGMVPQMADTDVLIRTLGTQGIVVSALLLNGRGLERALACGVAHVSMSVSISDTHSRKNTRRSAREGLEGMVELIREATAAGLHVRAGLQSAFGCVYEGEIQESDVLAAAEKLHAAGAGEINLADTSGMATPASVHSLVQLVAGELPDLSLSLHLHDTRGLGLVNMYSGYLSGVRVFDVCTGGLGGCPFVRGAAGNVPTEDAVNMFESMGVATGVELERLLTAVEYLEKLLERRLPGRMKRVYDYRKSCADEINGLS